MQEYKEYEFKFEIIQIYERQETCFAIWCRGDYLSGDVLMPNGDVGYIGQCILGENFIIHYILDLSYNPIAKYCPALKMFLDVKYFYPSKRNKFGLNSESKFACQKRELLRKGHKYSITGINCIVTGKVIKVDMDHLMPVSVCIKPPFENLSSNVYPLHQALNRSKTNKNVFDWIDWMTQEHLDRLLIPHGISIEIAEFKDSMNSHIEGVAESLGMSFSEYQRLYTVEYST